MITQTNFDAKVQISGKLKMLKNLSLPLLVDVNKSDEAEKRKIERYLIFKKFRMTIFFINRKQNKLTKLRM